MIFYLSSKTARIWNITIQTNKFGYVSVLVFRRITLALTSIASTASCSRIFVQGTLGRPFILFIMFNFTETESGLCLVPVFDVTAMLTISSIINHCIHDENCTRVMWTQSSYEFYTQDTWHYWNLSLNSYTITTEIMLLHHVVRPCAMGLYPQIWSFLFNPLKPKSNYTYQQL